MVCGCRGRFEVLCTSFMQRCLQAVAECLSKAEMNRSDIHKVNHACFVFCAFRCLKTFVEMSFVANTLSQTFEMSSNSTWLDKTRHDMSLHVRHDTTCFCAKTHGLDRVSCRDGDRVMSSFCMFIVNTGCSLRWLLPHTSFTATDAGLFFHCRVY